MSNGQTGIITILKAAFHCVNFHNWNHNCYRRKIRRKLLHTDDNHDGDYQRMFHDDEFTGDVNCQICQRFHFSEVDIGKQCLKLQLCQHLRASFMSELLSYRWRHLLRKCKRDMHMPIDADTDKSMSIIMQCCQKLRRGKVVEEDTGDEVVERPRLRVDMAEASGHWPGRVHSWQAIRFPHVDLTHHDNLTCRAVTLLVSHCHIVGRWFSRYYIRKVDVFSFAVTRRWTSRRYPCKYSPDPCFNISTRLRHRNGIGPCYSWSIHRYIVNWNI